MLPRILIPGRVAPAGKANRHAVAFAGLHYLAAVERAGGIGLVVQPVGSLPQQRADALLETADGLLLLGGPDVDPTRYGAEPHPATYGVRPNEDDFEVALVRAAVVTGIPVLAICRGAQVLNVAFGGSLHQHLPDCAGVLDHARPAFPALEPGAIGPIVEVALEPSSRTARAMGTNVAAGAHSHHQAIDRLGEGLVVVGRAADGVIEAVEHDSRHGWVVAVQWHPEDTAAADRTQQALFDAFVEQARRYHEAGH